MFGSSFASGVSAGTELLDLVLEKRALKRALMTSISAQSVYVLGLRVSFSERVARFRRGERGLGGEAFQRSTRAPMPTGQWLGHRR